MKRVVNTDCPAQRAQEALNQIEGEYNPVISQLGELLDTYDEGSPEHRTISAAIELLERSVRHHRQQVELVHELRRTHYPEEYED